MKFKTVGPYQVQHPTPWRGEPFDYFQIKRDGYRMVIRDGHAWLVLREVTDVVRHCDWWSYVDGGKHDGELYVPNKPASEVPHCLAESVNRLRYAVFGLLTDYEYVAEDPDSTLEVLTRYYLPPGYASEPEEITKWVERWYRDLKGVVPDIEGLVLKTDDDSGWYKYKPTQTVDAVVTGLKEGNGKYTGMIGALIVGVWHEKELVPIANVSGMDEEIRYNLCDDDIGRVVEVEYQYVGAKGRLRHPRFKRFRDDKTAAECTYDQLDVS